jgi:pSer/pThr/pTyr-binding forkhead associated (FHA) protein
MGKLVHIVDGAFVREYPLEEGTFRIGRDVENDIQLDDDAVSGSHVEIAVKPSQYMEGLHDYWLRDKGSTNGTKVNGKRVKKTMLKHDDVVKVGTHQFKFVDANAVARTRTRILINE